MIPWNLRFSFLFLSDRRHTITIFVSHFKEYCIIIQKHSARLLAKHFSLVQDFGLKHHSEMRFKSVSSITLALISVVLVGTIRYANESAQDMFRFSERSNVYSSTKFFAYNSKVHDYTAQRSTTKKPFIYLTETEQCLPENLASSAQIGDQETCNCDVIVLSFLENSFSSSPRIAEITR